MTVWKRTRDYGTDLIGGGVFSAFGVFLILIGTGHVGGAGAEPWALLTLGIAVLAFAGFILLHALHGIFSGGGRQSDPRIIEPVERGSGVLATWVGAGVMTIFPIGLGGALLSGRGSGNMPEGLLVAMLGIFVLAGLALAGYAVWLTMGALRYGRLPLHLEEAPVRVGGPLKAYVELPPGFAPPRVRATLQCFLVGADPKGQTREHTTGGAVIAAAKSHWKEARIVQPRSTGRGRRIDLEFDVPGDLPASTFSVHDPLPQARQGRRFKYLCRWQLKLSADVPGPDLSRSYELPMHGAVADAAAGGEAGQATQPPGDLDEGRREAMRRIAAAELAGGIAPAALAAKLGGLGIPGPEVHAALASVRSALPAAPAAALGEFLKEQARIERESASGGLTLLRRGAAPAARPQQSPTAGWAGPPVELAGTAQLLLGNRQTGRMMTGFGLVWLGAVAYVLVSGYASDPGAVPFFSVIGLVCLAIGLFNYGLHKRYRLVPTRGEIEVISGWYGSEDRSTLPLADFSRVRVEEHVTHTRKGRKSTTYRVYLQAGNADAGDLPCGDFRRMEDALDTAIHIARSTRLELEDRVTDGEVRVPFEVLNRLGVRPAQPPLLRRASALALLAANAVPLAGVLFFAWPLFPVLMLFWLENLIIGVMNIARMLMCERATWFPKLLLTLFFPAHFGGFCFLHGYVLVRLFAPQAPGADAAAVHFDAPYLFGLLYEHGLWIGVLALLASHMYSFFANYLGRDEYRRTNLERLMLAPYARVVVMHVLVIVGAFAVSTAGAPVLLVALLVVFKTVIDLVFHRKGHTRYDLAGYFDYVQSRSPAAGTAYRGLLGLAGTLAGAAALALVIGYLMRALPPFPAQPAVAAATKATPRTAPAATRTVRAPVAARTAPATTRTAPVSVRTAVIDAPDAATVARWESYLRRLDELTTSGSGGLERLLETVQQEIGADHPVTALVHVRLAEHYQAEGRRRQYREALMAAHAIAGKYTAEQLRAQIPPGHGMVHRGRIALSLGEYFLDDQRYLDSHDYYREALSLAGGDAADADTAGVRARAAIGVIATTCRIGRQSRTRDAVAVLEAERAMFPDELLAEVDTWITVGNAYVQGTPCAQSLR